MDRNNPGTVIRIDSTGFEPGTARRLAGVARPVEQWLETWADYLTSAFDCNIVLVLTDDPQGNENDIAAEGAVLYVSIYVPMHAFKLQDAELGTVILERALWRLADLRDQGRSVPTTMAPLTRVDRDESIIHSDVNALGGDELILVAKISPRQFAPAAISAIDEWLEHRITGVAEIVDTSLNEWILRLIR